MFNWEGLIVGLVELGRLIFFPQQYALNILPPKSRWRRHAFDFPAVSQSMIEKLKNKIGQNTTWFFYFSVLASL